MPIYEYRCGKCEQSFEQLVSSFEAGENVECPGCGSKKVTRLPSVFAARDGQSQSPATAPTGCQGCSQAGGGCPYQG